MAISKFQRRAFGHGSTYVCGSCGHNTRNVGGDEAGCDLCLLCYEEAGIENAHADGYHKDEPATDCYQCNPKVKTVKQIRAEQLAKKNGKPGTSPAPKTEVKERQMATKNSKHPQLAKVVKKLTKAIKGSAKKIVEGRIQDCISRLNELVKEGTASKAEGRKIRRFLRANGIKGGAKAKK